MLLKNRWWEVKGSGRVIKGVEQTKVKYIHSRDTLRNPFEHNSNNEKQDCKIGIVCVWGSTSGREEDE
jgi:hypothetical protein